MDRFLIRRRLQQFVLDGLFVALLAHFFVTGSVAPSSLIDLFRDQPAIVVASEPVHPHVPGEAPATETDPGT